jgi:hypothetical protein
MSGPSGNGSSAISKPKVQAQKPASASPETSDLSYWEPRLVCSLCLSHLSEMTEQYMRSPPFLAWLRWSIQLENNCSRWVSRCYGALTPGPAVPPPTPIDH